MTDESPGRPNQYDVLLGIAGGIFAGSLGAEAGVPLISAWVAVALISLYCVIQVCRIEGWKALG